MEKLLLHLAKSRPPIQDRESVSLPSFATVADPAD